MGGSVSMMSINIVDKKTAKQIIDNAPVDKITIICLDRKTLIHSGESSYFSKIRCLYPKHIFELLDRESIDISGTEIRKNPKKYEDMIHPLFREYLYEKKIL